MSLSIKVRKLWLAADYSYPETNHVRGGTFIYCNHPVPILNKLGRRTGRYEPCGHKLRTFPKLFRHIGRKH